MKFTDWFENRTGALGFVQKFLGEPVSSTTGWRNTLGSVAEALIRSTGDPVLVVPPPSRKQVG